MLAALAGIGSGMAQSPQPPPEQAKIYAELIAEQRAAQGGDCAGALKRLTPVLDRPAFAALPDPVRLGGYMLAAACAANTRQLAAAYSFAVKATGVPGAGTPMWALRFGLEMNDARPDRAVETVETMARVAPESLNALRVREIYPLANTLRRGPDKALRRRFLVVVAAPTYQPDDDLGDTDNFKRDYALVLEGEGDRAGALKLAAMIASPPVLMALSVDPVLREALPGDFDGRAAMERDLAKTREIAASHAGWMRPVRRIAEDLRQLGRMEEALATLEAARPDGPAGKAFTDIDEQNWWWDELARSHARLGRYDEAVAAFRGGMAKNEQGMPNISQTLNLAELQIRFGHPADALATMASVGEGKNGPSPYGLMVLHDLRGCARAALGQRDRAREDLAYAVAHERDSRGGLVELQLCLGEADAAAAVLIRQLDERDERAAALLQLSDYDDPPPAAPRDPATERLRALKTRADVQAAIARAGGTRRFRLQDLGL